MTLKSRISGYRPDNQFLAFQALLFVLAIVDLASDNSWRRIVDLMIILIMSVSIALGLYNRRQEKRPS